MQCTCSATRAACATQPQALLKLMVARLLVVARVVVCFCNPAAVAVVKIVAQAQLQLHLLVGAAVSKCKDTKLVL